MASLSQPPAARSFNPDLSGGRVCSLDFRPRRWFGYRIDDVISDFLKPDGVELSGIAVTLVDLLRGAVRAELDERVLVSAHHSPSRGAALVTVTLFFKVPTVNEYEVEEVLALLGRSDTQTSYFRMATREGAWAVRGSLNIKSTVITAIKGEATVVSSLTVSARAVQPNPEREQTQGTPQHGA